jgi:heptosyltransferase II
MSGPRLPFLLRSARIGRITLLTGLHWILFGRRYSAATPAPTRIAVLRFSAVGDFLLAIPSVVKLRSAFPDAKIMLITAASSQQSVQQSTLRYNKTSHPAPWIKFVHPSLVDHVSWIDSFSWKSLLRINRPEVKRFNPELTFILPQQDGGSLRSLIMKMIFLRLLGVHSPVLGWRAGMGPLFHEWLFTTGRLKHAVFAPLAAINEALAPDAPNTHAEVRFTLDIPAEDRAWARTLKSRLGWTERRVIAISPDSVQPHKKWPGENFIQLARRLCETTDACIAIVGTSACHALGEAMIAGVENRAVNLCGETTIQRLASWLENCSMLVGNDGGSMHVAAGVGCPAVAIMPGIEYPGSIEPWGYEAFSVRHAVPCAPCYSFTHCPLGHNRCLTEISVEDVLAKCVSLLHHAKPPVNNRAHTP